MKIKVHCSICKKEYQYEIDAEKIAINQCLFVYPHMHQESHLHVIWVSSSGKAIQHNELPLNGFTEDFTDIATKNVFPLRITDREFIFATFSEAYEFPSIELFIFIDPSDELKSNIINFKKLVNNILNEISPGKLVKGLFLQKISFLKLSEPLIVPKFFDYPISVTLRVYFLSDSLVKPKVAEYNNYLVPIIPRTYMYDILLSHDKKRRPLTIFRLLGSHIGFFYLFSILSIVLTFGVSILIATLAVFNSYNNYSLLLYLLPLVSLFASGHFEKQAKKLGPHLFNILNLNMNAKLEWKNYQFVNLAQDIDLTIVRDDIYLHMSKAYSSILAAKTEIAIKSLKSAYRAILSLYSGIKFGLSFDTQAVIKKLSTELGYPYRQLLTFWDILSISKTGMKTVKISSLELMYVYNAIYELCIQLNLLEQKFPNFKEYVTLRKPPLKELSFASVMFERKDVQVKESEEKAPLSEARTETVDAEEINKVTENSNIKETSKESKELPIKEKIIELSPKLELSLDDILTLKTEEMIAHYIEDAYMSEDPVFIYFRTGSEKESDLNNLLKLFSTLQTNYPESITLIADVVPQNFQTEIKPGQILYLDKGQRKTFNINEMREALTAAKPTQD